MRTGEASASRGHRSERLLLAIGGQTVFACLVAILSGAPPALEATIAFGLAIAIGLDLQGRREHAHARAARRPPVPGRRNAPGG